MSDRKLAQEQAEQVATERYNQGIGGTIRPKPRLVYELEQQREYHLRKLIDIQNAIDIVNRTTY